MATATFRPISDGYSETFTPSTGTDHYALVDEASPNEDTDYVYTALTGKIDAFNTDDTDVDAQIPDGSTINSVTVYWRLKYILVDDVKRAVVGMVRLAGSNTVATGGIPTTSYVTLNAALGKPGGGSWTKQNIKDMEFGIVSTGSAAPRDDTRITQVYIIVDYTAPAAATITGYVREWSMSTAVPGVKVKYYYNGTYVASSYSNSVGLYQTTAFTHTGLAKVVPSKYQWEFTPTYHTTFGITSNTARSFILGPDTWWPNLASTYAFRKAITVSTPHTTINKGSLLPVSIATGKQIAIGFNTMRDEGADHSGGNNIAYFDNKTHIVWKTLDGYIDGRTRNHLTDTWSSIYRLAPSRSATDAHYAGNIDIDHDGYIHLVNSGHDDYCVYYMCATANDLGSRLTHTAVMGVNGTYPRVRVDNENRLFTFYRSATGVVSNWQYDYKLIPTDTAWIKNQRVVRSTRYSYTDEFFQTFYSIQSCYCGGVQIDKNNYIHLVVGIDDTYGTTNLWRLLYYLYSPPSWDAVNSTTRPGLYWYAVNGANVAILTNNTTQPMRDQSATADAAIVVKAFNSIETPGTYSYITNSEGLALHPSLTYYNGKHTIPRTYFTFSETVNYSDFSPSKPFVAWYDSASPRANSYKWAIANLSTAILTNGYAASSRAWKARHYGGIAIDREGDIYVYGFQKEGQYKDSAWWGGELQEWTSQNNGTTWDWRLLTRRSSQGVPMVNLKKSMTNNLLELIYGRGNNVMYYSEDLQEGRFRDNGYDVSVVYTGGNSTNQQLDCVADYWNFSTSTIYVDSHTTIPTQWVYDTAGMHYIYYGKYATSVPLSNPKNIFGFYENFEGFNTGANITSRGTWRFNSGRGVLTTALCTIVDSITDHTNKIWSGDRSLKYRVISSNYSTAYVYTTLPSGYTDNVVIEGSIWEESDEFGLFGVSYGSTNTVLGVRINVSDKWSWFDGTTWRTSDINSGVAPTRTAYHRVKISCVNSKVNFFVDGGASSLAGTNLNIPTGALSKVIVGNSNPYNYSGESAQSVNFYDFLYAYKVSPQE